MALSAKERREWRELERQLTAKDLSLVQPAEDLTLTQPVKGHGATHRSVGMAGSILAAVMVLAAFAVVILAIIVKILLIGVLGFALMIFGGSRFQIPGLMGQPAKAPSLMRGDVL